MIDATALGWLALALIGLVGSAACSGLEVGLYSVSRVLMRVRSVTHGAAARMDRELDHIVPVLTTLLAYNNIFNYLGTLAITALLTRTGLGDGAIIVLQAIVLTPVILIFAESTPKEIFRSRANTLMERAAPWLVVMRLSMTVTLVVPLIRLVAGALSSLLGADLTGSVRSARESMTDLIKHGDERISAEQSALIDRALELGRTPVEGVMVPLSRARRLGADDPPERARSVARRAGRARLPVHDRSGRVVGCVAAIDLHAHPRSRPGALVRPVSRVAHDASIRSALLTLRDEGSPMGIVTRGDRDVGLVTRRDLMAPLLGVRPG